MLGALATAFLSIATLADVTARDRSRVMLGQWRRLFEERGMALAINVVDKLSGNEHQQDFRQAQTVFEQWLIRTQNTPNKETAEKLALLDVEEATGKTVWLTEVTLMGTGVEIWLEKPRPFQVIQGFYS